MIVTQAIRRGLRRIRGPGVVAKVVRGTGVAFAVTALGQALSAVLQIVLARTMGRVEYGTYTWVSAWIPTLVIPLGLGLPQAAVRFLPEYEALGDQAHRKGFARFSQGIVLVATVGFAIAATIALVIVGSRRALPVFYPMLVAIWTVPVSTQLSLLSQMCRALRRMALAFGPIRVVSPAILIVSVIALYALGYRPQSAIVLGIALVILFVLICAQQTLFARDFARSQPAGGAPARYDGRRWLAVALPLMAMAACQTLLYQIDILTVGAMRGPRDAAVYGAGDRLVSLIGFTLVTATLAVGPEVADLHSRGEKALLQKAVTATIKMGFWPALAAGAALVAFGRPILALFGHGYSAGYLVMCVLAVGALVNAATGPVLVLLNMTGFERQSTQVLAFCTVLDLALNIALVHIYGYAGAAFASAGVLILWNIWLVVLAKRHLGIDSLVGLAR